MSSEIRTLVVALTLTAAVLFAALIGTTAAVITRFDHGSMPSAILRGGVAFGATLTLILTVTTAITSLLG